MIDPRANSPEKLVPTPPLPMISRGALRRVKDCLPVPCSCPYCGGPVTLTSNAAIYGSEYGRWPYVYLCKPCDAYVGLHPATDLPLGTLANAQLRNARKTSKSAFHALMERRDMKRGDAYAWLSGRMGIPKAEAHFGMFDLERCRAAYRVCMQALRGQQ